MVCGRYPVREVILDVLVVDDKEVLDDEGESERSSDEVRSC